MYKQVHGSCIYIIYFPGVEYLNMCAENFISVPMMPYCEDSFFTSGIPKTKDKQLLPPPWKKYPTISPFPPCSTPGLSRWRGRSGSPVQQKKRLEVMLWEQRELKNPRWFLNKFITSMIQSFKVVVIHRYSPANSSPQFFQKIISQLCPGMASQQSGSLQGL